MTADEIARGWLRLHLLKRRLVAIGDRLEAEVRGTGYGLWSATIRDRVTGEEVAFGGGSSEETALHRARKNAGLI